MSDTGDTSQHQHQRSKSNALSLLRRKDRDNNRNEDDTASDDGSHVSALASPGPTIPSPASIPLSHQQSVRSHNSRMSHNRLSLREPGGLAPPSLSRSNTVPASAERTTSLESSVRKFRIVEALRSGNTAAISKAIRDTSENGPRASTSTSTSSVNTVHHAPLEDTTVLHLAIQCAEYDVVEYVLSDGLGFIDVNARDKDGNTPLHIAALQGRGTVVHHLLEQKGINDAIANNQGKLPLDVARSPEIFQQLQLARTLFVQDKVKQVQELVHKGDYDTLGHVLEEPRVTTILDINSIELPSDPTTVTTGGTLLHEAARKRDSKLIQALLLHGADPFQRDRNGKLAQHVTNDEITRAMLKKSPAAVAAQRNIQEKAVLGHASSQAGSSTALADPVTSREPIMKGYLKKWTNYRKGYQLRWFVLENGVLSYYKHQDDAESACRGAISMRIAKLYMSPDDKTKFEIIGKSSVKYTLRANHEAEAKRWFWALNNAIQWMKDQAKQEEMQKAQSAEMLRQAKDQLAKSGELQVHDMHSEAASIGEPRNSVQLTRLPSAKGSIPRHVLSHNSMHNSASGSADDEFFDPGAAEDTSKMQSSGDPAIPGSPEDEDEDYAAHSSQGETPIATKDAFNITAQSAKLQLDTLAQVSSALQAEVQRNPSMSLGDPKLSQALVTYDAAIKSLKGLMGDLLRISRDRDAHWQYRLDQEVEMRQMWEESMAKVAQEQEILEARVDKAELKHKKTKRALRDVIEGVAGSRPSSVHSSQAVPLASSGVIDGDTAVTDAPKSPASLSRRPTALSQVVDISEDSESEEEEFFDAVDAGEVEVGPMPPADVRPSGTTQELATTQKDVSSAFNGYENGVRTKLKLDADNRPKISLWGILKSMIGKDMTKMTLPVSFNEPTSLLYRTGEDMEYAELLDQAADRQDSIERMLYVAAFAASEFASTIGRVAKPFNPLLGETFEYVRPDKGYRFFIEQVSHHPPIGAAHAESAKWTYWGEANVKSKFLGKSFDIHHVGTWFLKLRPTAGGEEDFYTWKKPTSQVVGIITGNPVVDNYGLVEIKNWTTGDTCVLDFKQRGWKASSAYHLSGKILDAGGRPRMSIGGRWNSKIYARLTPGFETAVEEPQENSRGSINDPSRAFVVWQAHERPEGIPFNLTPFVLTFNHLDDALRRWIAPTDSRYRPDQRAMEEGEYDLAAAEKNRLEEGQRARRRARELRGEEFEPAWFARARCDVTGEEYWSFNDRYWAQRERFGSGDPHAWDGLEPLFSEA